MTEDEAKTKTCLKTLTPVASADGSAPWFSYQPCLGSACMAWRWEPRPARYDGTSLVVEYPAPPPTDGFCGLAGAP